MTPFDHRTTYTVEEEEEAVEVAKVIFLRNKDTKVEEVPNKDADVVEVLEMKVPIPGQMIVTVMNLSQALLEIFSKISHVLDATSVATIATRAHTSQEAVSSPCTLDTVLYKEHCSPFRRVGYC